MGTGIVTMLTSIGGGGGSLLPKVINVPADFPTILEANAQMGRLYIAGADVTDSDPTKTNTGQSFLSGNEFVWNGTNYTDLGPDAIWLDDGSVVKTVSPRDIDVQNKILKNVADLQTAILTLTGSSVNEIVTTLSGSSTDLQLATAKAIEAAIAAGSGITPQDLTSQLGAGGETNFTLSSAPVAGNKSLLFYNGQLVPYGAFYTISGTTLTWVGSYPLASIVSGVTFWIFYDITLTPPGTLDQKQIYYAGDSGNDLNNGKSIEKPFLTPTAAAAAIVAETPSTSNRFELQMIGGMDYTGNLTVPDYTTVTGTGRITGNVILGIESHIKINHVEGKITKATSGNAFIDCPTINNNVDSAIEHSAGNLYVNSNIITNAGANQCILKTGTSTEMFLNVGKIISSATTDALDFSGDTGFTYLNINEITKTGAGAAIRLDNFETLNGRAGQIKNSLGDWLNISNNCTLALSVDELIGTITDDASNIIDIIETKIPEVITSMATLRLNATGNGAIYTLPFDNIIEQHNITYAPLTGIVTVQQAGAYFISTNIEMTNLAATNTSGRIKLQATSTNPTIHKANYGAMRDSSNNLVVGGSVVKKFIVGDTFKITLQITGGAGDNVNVQIGSTFSANLIRHIS